ncbi:MAG TPA: hypothetical protein VD811_11465 [Desulfuromonadales bacterium]|nr:hypothetical protein [Desulfuromonadales bacterium]
MMKGVLAVIGATVGVWRRGLGGAVLGAAAGWGVGTLLTARGPSVRLPEEEHYRRYPEEEIVDALRDAGDEPEVEGAEMDDLYREVGGAS